MNSVYRTAVENQTLDALNNLDLETHIACLQQATKLRKLDVIIHMLNTWVDFKTYRTVLKTLESYTWGERFDAQKRLPTNNLINDMRQYLKLPIAKMRPEDKIKLDTHHDVMEWKNNIETCLVKQTQRDGYWFREARTLTPNTELLQNFITNTQCDCMCVRQPQGFRMYYKSLVFVFDQGAPVLGGNNTLHPPEVVGKCYSADTQGKVSIDASDITPYTRLITSYQTFIDQVSTQKYTLTQHGIWYTDKTFYGFWYYVESLLVISGVFNRSHESMGAVIMWDFKQMTKYVGQVDRDLYHGKGKVYDLILPNDEHTVAPHVKRQWCEDVISNRNDQHVPGEWRLSMVGSWNQGNFVKGIEKVWDDEGCCVDFDHNNVCQGRTNVRKELYRLSKIVAGLTD